MSRGARAGVAAGALLLAVGLFILLKPDDDAPEPERSERASGRSETTRAPERSPAPRRETIEVADGKPVGGVREISYEKGDRVRLTISSRDTSGHVHVHGYDKLADLEPGTAARFRFEATIDGVFEVELEDTRTPLAELRVRP